MRRTCSGARRPAGCPSTGRRVADGLRQRRVALERWRSRGPARRGAGCAGPCAAASAGRDAPQAGGERGHPVAGQLRLELRADAGVRRQGVGVDPERTRPGARTRSRRPGSRCRPARPAPPSAAERERRGSRPPSTAGRARRGRSRGGRPAPAPRRSPWPCRCRGRGRPAASPRRRSRPGSRAPASRSASAMASAGLAGGGRPADDDERREAQARVPRSAYGPAWSIATRTSRPSSVGRPRDVDQLVLARAPQQVRRRRPAGGRRRPATRPCRVGLLVLAWSWARGGHDRVHEDLRRPTEPGAVPLEPDPLLDRQQLRPAGAASRRRARRRRGASRASPAARCRRRRRPGRSGRSRAGRSVASYSASVSPQKPTMTSVRERDPRHRLADAGEALEVVLDRVLAAHPPEHRVGARLDGQVQRLADRRAVPHRLDQPVRQVPRVRGDEPQPRDRGAAPSPAARSPSTARISSARSGRASRSWCRPTVRAVHDVPEPGLGRQVVAVAVDVLAEERDLPVAGRGQGPRLVHDLVERPAPLRAAAERDDAVGAGLVAAVDDRQPGADRGAAADGAPGDGVGPRPDEVRRRPTPPRP